MNSPIARRPFIRLDAEIRRCASCGLQVAALVEIAHVPDWRTNPDKYVPLCLLCHRAYDIGLVTEDEVEAVRDAWLAGASPPHDAPSCGRCGRRESPSGRSSSKAPAVKLA